MRSFPLSLWRRWDEAYCLVFSSVLPQPPPQVALVSSLYHGNRNLVKTAHLWPAKSRPFGQLSASSLKITRNVTQRQSSYTICGRVKTFKIVKGKLRKETLRSMVKTRTMFILQ